MESPLIDLGEQHLVTFTPKGAASSTPVWDAATETMSFTQNPSPDPVTLTCFVFPRGQGSGGGRQGLDLDDGRVILQIVGTPDDTPLKLPDGVSSGDKGSVTLLGVSGTLEVQALSPTQIPEVSDENGWLYYAQWSAVS